MFLIPTVLIRFLCAESVTDGLTNNILYVPPPPYEEQGYQDTESAGGNMVSYCHIPPPQSPFTTVHPSVQPWWRSAINKCRKRDIYKTLHPRQPTHSDMRTDCLRVWTDWLCPAFMFYVCTMIEDRHGGGVRVFMCPPYIPENKQGMKGRYCSSGPADVQQVGQWKAHSGFSIQPLPPGWTFGRN